MSCQDHLYRNRSDSSRRRWFFKQCGVGLGAHGAGRSCWRSLAASAVAATDPLAPKQPQFPAKAKNVIFLFMAGAPEPSGAVRQQAAAGEVRRHAAAAGAAEGLSGGVHQSEFETARARNSSSPSTGRAARSCRNCCRIWPKVVDDIAIVKSMVTDAFNHAPGQILMNTGSQQFGRPSMGAWVTYGLGSESQDLPGVRGVQLRQERARAAAIRAGAAAFCRRCIRACRSAASGDPVLYLSNPRGVDRRAAARFARCHRDAERDASRA